MHLAVADCASICKILRLKCFFRHTYILLFKFTSQVTLYKCCFTSATITNQDKLRTEKGRESRAMHLETFTSHSSTDTIYYYKELSSCKVL